MMARKVAARRRLQNDFRQFRPASLGARIRISELVPTKLAARISLRLEIPLITPAAFQRIRR
jgi:ketopantoate hydroxymethyltransferase